MKRFGLILGLILLTFFSQGCASVDADKVSKSDREPQMDEDVGNIPDLKVSEFIIGVGDTIQVSVYRNDELNKSVTINTSGKMMYPLIGDVQVAGKDVSKLRDEIQARLSEYIISPQVSINVTSIQSKKIMILGEVNRPGILTLDSQLSIIESIAKAGGATNDAKLDNIVLIRRRADNKPGIILVDLKKAFEEGDISQNRLLQAGDIVYLPTVTIANVSWYLAHISKILSPIVNLESGIILAPQAIDALSGNTKNTAPLSIPAK